MFCAAVALTPQIGDCVQIIVHSSCGVSGGGGHGGVAGVTQPTDVQTGCSCFVWQFGPQKVSHTFGAGVQSSVGAFV